MSDSPSVKSDKKNRKKKRDTVILAGVTLIMLFLVFILYKSWLQVGEKQKSLNDSAQEEFVGDVQVSESLQADCQRSAEKIALLEKSGNVTAMFAEYQLNANNCKQAYFSFEKKIRQKNTKNEEIGAEVNVEGVYPNLAIDIALVAAQSNKMKAIEILNFAKSIGSWNFDIGPIACESKTVIEAYLESLNLPDEKICFKKDLDTEKLISALKDGNFSVLSSSLQNTRVVYLGLINSDVGCPEKISSAIRFIQKTIGPDYNVVEAQQNIEQHNVTNFIFKTTGLEPEDKLTLVFDTIEECMQLKYILVTDPQADE